MKLQDVIWCLIVAVLITLIVYDFNRNEVEFLEPQAASESNLFYPTPY